MPAVRINEVLAYILGLDIYRADGQRQMAAIKAGVSRAHPEGQSLIRVAVARTLATTDPREILAALKKRHENYTKLPFLSVPTALDKLLAAAPPLARSKMSAAEKAYRKKQATLSAEMVAANRAYKKKHGMSKTESLIASLTRKKNPPPSAEDQRARATMRPIIAHAKAAGEGCRGEGHTLPTDNFWYAWLIAALARGVVRNETGDRFTQQLSNMTLRQIAILADDDPSFYDT